jgi:hypothetical protein
VKPYRGEFPSFGSVSNCFVHQLRKQGFAFLRRTLEEGNPVDRPARAVAAADLGLAYLMLGNGQSGLQWLHRAQARFATAGAHDHLRQSLENELVYMEHAKNKSEAKSLRQRIEQLEADGEIVQTAGWFGAELSVCVSVVLPARTCCMRRGAVVYHG